VQRCLPLCHCSSSDKLQSATSHHLQSAGIPHHPHSPTTMTRIDDAAEDRGDDVDDDVDDDDDATSCYGAGQLMAEPLQKLSTSQLLLSTYLHCSSSHLAASTTPLLRGRHYRLHYGVCPFVCPSVRLYVCSVWTKWLPGKARPRNDANSILNHPLLAPNSKT